MGGGGRSRVGETDPQLPFAGRTLEARSRLGETELRRRGPVSERRGYVGAAAWARPEPPWAIAQVCGLL